MSSLQMSTAGFGLMNCLEVMVVGAIIEVSHEHLPSRAVIKFKMLIFLLNIYTTN